MHMDYATRLTWIRRTRTSSCSWLQHTICQEVEGGAEDSELGPLPLSERSAHAHGLRHHPRAPRTEDRLGPERELRPSHRKEGGGNALGGGFALRVRAGATQSSLPGGGSRGDCREGWPQSCDGASAGRPRVLIPHSESDPVDRGFPEELREAPRLLPVVGREGKGLGRAPGNEPREGAGKAPLGEETARGEEAGRVLEREAARGGQAAAPAHPERARGSAASGDEQCHHAGSV